MYIIVINFIYYVWYLYMLCLYFEKKNSELANGKQLHSMFWMILSSAQ